MKNDHEVWIRHTHLFEADEYECSNCGKIFKRPEKACPACGIKLRGIRDPQDWVDEAAEMDWMMGD